MATRSSMYHAFVSVSTFDVSAVNENEISRPFLHHNSFILEINLHVMFVQSSFHCPTPVFISLAALPGVTSTRHLLVANCTLFDRVVGTTLAFLFSMGHSADAVDALHDPFVFFLLRALRTILHF
jgi:hypothetical protein